MYRKRHCDAKAEYLINHALTKNREKVFREKEEEPIRAETVPLGFNVKNHAKILKKNDSMWLGQLGEINDTSHPIYLIPGTRPLKCAPYRVGPKTRELEQSEIRKQLSAGLIEPAQSACASPILFVPKKDVSIRFFIDYRKLNEVTVKDSYPIPRMDRCASILLDAPKYSLLWMLTHVIINSQSNRKTNIRPLPHSMRAHSNVSECHSV